jgi:hypothetical protein
MDEQRAAMLAELVDMGFVPERCEVALERTGGELSTYRASHPPTGCQATGLPRSPRRDCNGARLLGAAKSTDDVAAYGARLALLSEFAACARLLPCRLARAGTWQTTSMSLTPSGRALVYVILHSIRRHHALARSIVFCACCMRFR